MKDLTTGAILTRGRSKNDVYEWPSLQDSNSVGKQAYVGVKTSIDCWHDRLGHPSTKILTHIISHFKLPIHLNPSKFSFCDSCHCNKSHRLPFGVSSLQSREPLDLLYTDVWGPSPIRSMDGYSYYVIFVDHFTKYSWLFPLAHKSDVSSIFPKFKTMVEKFFKTSIRTIYSDGGTEYQSLKPLFANSGIQHLISPPYTPQHIASAERRHRHIVETGLTLLHRASLPLSLWSFAFKTAVYLINRLPTPILDHKSPFESLLHTRPNFLPLRIFGCLCYPWLRPYTTHKLDQRSKSCIFLGYSDLHHSYICFEPVAHKFYFSRHVQFVETCFPSIPTHSPSDKINSHTLTKWASISPSLYSLSPTPSPSPHSSLPDSSTTSLSPTSIPICIPSPPPPPSSRPSISTYSPSNSPSSSFHTSTTSPCTSSTPHLAAPSLTDLATSSTDIPSAPFSSETAPSSGNLSPPPPAAPSNTHTMVTRYKNNIYKPLTKVSYPATKHPLPHTLEPSTVTQALQDSNWRAAMCDEFNALLRTQTWNLVPRFSPMNVIGCKWVFRVKRNPDGSVSHYKARLVAKGFHQRPGIDYQETFSPVIKPTTIRVVLSLALSHDWPVHQLDVNNDFLHGHLMEEVYMSQPPGFVDPTRPDHVCRLHKSLYGLKQAPRAWFHELKSFIISLGFVNSRSDASLFVYSRNSHQVYFLVYVDDLLITGSSASLVQQIISSLARRFSIKDLGLLHFFLGVEVISTADGLFLSQHKYIQDLLVRFNLAGMKETSTPSSPSAKLLFCDGSPPTDATQFRSLIGGMQYLSLTRPYIAYTVNKLAQFMHCPTHTH